MRSWLTQFLRNPRSLPPDLGSGYERISLTLPRELVRDVAGYLCCPPSQALRRLAQERLGPPQSARTPDESICSPTPLPGAENAPWRPAPAQPAVIGGRSREDAIRMAVAQLIGSLIPVALLLLVLYFSSKTKKQA